MTENKIGVIITVKENNDNLKAVMDCLDKQMYKDFFVVIVEDSKKCTFGIWHLDIKSVNCHFTHCNKQSLPASRNVGIDIALKYHPQYLLFIDDDVTFDNLYLTDMKFILETHPDTVCVSALSQGTQMPSKIGQLYRSIMNLCGNNILFLKQYPVNFKCSTTDVQWLPGYNLMVDTYMFDKIPGLRFDSHLKTYAIGEDVDFTNTIYKNMGEKSLMLTKTATLTHHNTVDRMDFQQTMDMYYIHFFYLLYMHNLNNNWYFIPRLTLSLASNIFLLLITDLFHLRHPKKFKSIMALQSICSCFKYMDILKTETLNLLFDKIGGRYDFTAVVQHKT